MNAKLHNADWTNALIGEYPSLMHALAVKAVAVMGSRIVTGCGDGRVRIWDNDEVGHTHSVGAAIGATMLHLDLRWLASHS